MDEEGEYCNSTIDNDSEKGTDEDDDGEELRKKIFFFV